MQLSSSQHLLFQPLPMPVGLAAAVPAWADLGALAWGGLAVSAWVVSRAHVLELPVLVPLASPVPEELASLALEEWHLPGLAGVPGSDGVPGSAEALGPADGLAADGLAVGAGDVGGLGGLPALASHWPPGGRTTEATVTTLASSGYRITDG